MTPDTDRKQTPDEPTAKALENGSGVLPVRSTWMLETPAHVDGEVLRVMMAE